MNDLFTPQETIPNEKSWYLVSRVTKGKIRVATVNYELINPYQNMRRDNYGIG